MFKSVHVFCDSRFSKTNPKTFVLPIHVFYFLCRETYSKYDDHFRYEVAVWAEKNGPRQAGRKFNLAESTVRGFLKTYRVQKSASMKSKTVKTAKRGRRTMLPSEIDAKVLDMVRSMRSAGAVTNFHTLIGLATGIVMANDRTLLKENGGHVEFTIGWCQSIYKRLNFVRRKATTAKPLIAPGLIDEMGFSFYKEINELVRWFNIPKELVINIDQTPLPFVLISSYTMEEKGNQCVPVSGTTDYRQITGTFGVSLSGDFLPIQLIYKGKTHRCQPNYPFPHEFHVTQNENHWANEDTSVDLLKKILIPYVQKTREKLSLPNDQPWLLIADVFKGQWTEAVTKGVSESHGKMCAVPSNMTNVYQPLDLSVNRSCKSYLRREAQCWYSKEIEKQVKEGKQSHEIKVDTRVSVVKPLHAKWVVSFYDYMNGHPEIVMSGWRKSKIDIAYERQSGIQNDPFL